MTETISEELLVSYVDGELETAEMRRIERLIEADPGLRETVRQLRESTASLRGAYQATLSDPIPARIYESIDRSLSFAAAGGGRPSLWQTAMAAAAAVVLALPLGYWLADMSWERRLEQQTALQSADREARLAALHSSLEAQISGETSEWRNPDSGALGQVMPVRTFKSASGQWCREYETRTERAGLVEIERGIACRGGEGQWHRRVVLVEES